MKSPIWEASPGALMALLFSAGPTERIFAYYDLYTITCVQGPVLRYTTCDRTIGYGGTVWAADGVRIEPAGQKNALFHAKVGLDVDTWQAVFYPRPVDDLTGAAYPDLIGSVPWLAAAAAGALSGATAKVDRAYFALPMTVTVNSGGNTYTLPMPVPLQPVGVLRLFAGRVAEVDLGRSGACITINSHLELLNVQMPGNLFQAGCKNKLFDAGCTLSAATYAVTTAAVAGSTRYKLQSAVAAPAGSGTYTLGRIAMTSGLNTGFTRSVRSWDGLNFTLVNPLPFTVAAGDTFTAWPGCDRQLATCDLFGNRANIKAEMFIPAPETAA